MLFAVAELLVDVLFVTLEQATLVTKISVVVITHSNHTSVTSANSMSFKQNYQQICVIIQCNYRLQTTCVVKLIAFGITTAPCEQNKCKKTSVL